MRQKRIKSYRKAMALYQSAFKFRSVEPEVAMAWQERPLARARR